VLPGVCIIVTISRHQRLGGGTRSTECHSSYSRNYDRCLVLHDRQLFLPTIFDFLRTTTTPTKDHTFQDC